MSFRLLPQAEQEMRKRVAEVLLRIATTIQSNEKAEWKQGPPRSKTGEHLRIDTGNAKNNLVYVPTSPAAVAENLEVQIGYRRNAFYVGLWEIPAKRRGLREKLQQFKNSGVLGTITGSYVT